MFNQESKTSKVAAIEFDQENKTPKIAAIQLYKYGGGQSPLVSKHCANLNLRLHNFVKFQPIFTNEVSNSKLQPAGSNKV